MHKAGKPESNKAKRANTNSKKKRGAEQCSTRREEKCVHQMIKTDRQLIGLI